MPLNIVHEANGFPRIILTEPRGSSAEVIGSYFLSVRVFFLKFLGVDSFGYG